MGKHLNGCEHGTSLVVEIGRVVEANRVVGVVGDLVVVESRGGQGTFTEGI